MGKGKERVRDALIGEVADLVQWGNVSVHGKGTVGYNELKPSLSRLKLIL